MMRPEKNLRRAVTDYDVKMTIDVDDDSAHCSRGFTPSQNRFKNERVETINVFVLRSGIELYTLELKDEINVVYLV